MPSRSILLATLLLVTGCLFSQDFDHYTTLHSKGGIPLDIVTPTSQKIADSKGSKKGDLSASQEKVFLEQVHYSVDDLLKSGMVVYGDSVTNYVKQVAQKLLSSDKELFNKLRFYTYKSNVANAFSTDQGIIFVTTGLVAQLSSEAQLAYVLAHEISHYTLKHVVQSYQFESASKNQTISRLSIYSKEKELEADKTAIALYNKAGYDKSELIVTFDVLMYSYLPFDEVEIPVTYYNDSLFYIPASAFPDKKYPIKKKEDYNDAASSHPNIKKRKEATEKTAAEYSTWDKNFFTLPEAEFRNVRNIARFECLRADLIEANFTNVLYNVYLLEKEYPDSYFLRKMKALAWLGLAQFKAAGKSGFSEAYKEGEIASYYQFLHKLNTQQVYTIALRQVRDFASKYPNETEAQEIYDQMIKTVAKSDKFKFGSYSSRTFAEASNPVVTVVDTTTVTITPTTSVSSSKYDKIRSSRNENPDKTPASGVDTTQYHLYGLSDIIKDEHFLKRYEYWKQENDSVSTDVDLANAILFSPDVEYFEGKKLNRVKSQKLNEQLGKTTNDIAQEAGGSILVLDDETLGANGTNEFNERSILVSNLLQSANYEDVGFYPVNKAELNKIASKERKDFAMFVHVRRIYHPEMSPGVFFVATSIVGIPWLLLDYVPYKLAAGNTVRLDLLAFDLKTGQPVMASSRSYSEKLTPLTYGAHIYRLFHNEKKI